MNNDTGRYDEEGPDEQVSNEKNRDYRSDDRPDDCLREASPEQLTRFLEKLQLLLAELNLPDDDGGLGLEV